MVYIARPCTAGDEVVGRVAIERHLLHGLTERQRFLILHEHHALDGRLARDLRMRLQVRFVGIFIALIARALLHEVEDAPHIPVEVGLGQFAALHPRHDGIELLRLSRL